MSRISSAAILFSSVFACLTFADSPVGTWSWSHPDAATQEEVTDVITIKDDGGKITGTYATPQGSLELENGKFESGQLSFEISFDAQGQTITAAFKGKVSGDSIDGTGNLPGVGEFPWTPKRETAKISAAGTWRWEFQDPASGQQTKATVEIQETGEELSGNYVTPQGNLPLSVLKLEGNKLTFGFEFGGNAITWWGDVDGNNITGKVKGDFGEFPWSAQRDAAKGSVTGKWTFMIDAPDGTTQQQYLTISGSGDDLTGKYEANDQELPVENVAFADGKLTFTVSVVQIGAEAEFEGKVDGDKAKGVTTIDASGQTMELNWTAEKE